MLVQYSSSSSFPFFFTGKLDLYYAEISRKIIWKQRSGHMLRIFVRLQIWRDQKGQDLVEYALMAALVATGTGILMPASVIPAMSSIYSRVNCVLSTVGGGGS
jgi:Flp pilus assembly pilin Flp